MEHQAKRLDLLDIYCELAKDEGFASISSGARSVHDFSNPHFGIVPVRRLEKHDILSGRPLSELHTLIKCMR